MKLAAIIKARAIALLDIDELNRNGVVRLADVAPLLTERYGFLTYPSTKEDFDIEKGIKFLGGRCEDVVIDTFSIWSNMLTVETLSSTKDSKETLENILKWGRELGLTYEDGMIKRWGYISQITFTTEFPLLSAVSVPLNNLARKTAEVVDSLFGEGITYEAARLNVAHDPLARKSGIAPLTIEHRVNVRFGDNKFFSEAPLPTDLHIKFLEEFEAEVLKACK